MTTQQQHETPPPRQSDSPPRQKQQRQPQRGNPVSAWIDTLRQRLSGAQMLPDPKPSGRTREQIQPLLDALGDPQHPAHAQAVDRLVEIGTPAIPYLNELLTSQQPWLSTYRAAEALGYIGDGRATGALIQALNHSNSNVRWSAVRALAQIGDLRALLELRRVANNDLGRTSWGESVAETARSALEQIRTRSMWGQGIELVKTAITSVLMILALVIAFSVVGELRAELARITDQSAAVAVQQALPDLPTPTAAPEAQAAAPLALPTEIPTRTPTTSATDETTTSELAFQVSSTVLQNSNVRADPSVRLAPVGKLREGDEIYVLGSTPEGNWYRIRLGEDVSPETWIDSTDETGWVSSILIEEPEGEIPVLDETDQIEPTSQPTPTVLDF